MVDVALAFLDRQRLGLQREGDALGQLAQRRIGQQFIELGLAEQDDLQQLALFGFQVGDQPHELESFAAEMLRFVDDQHREPVLRVLLDQELLRR